MSDDKDAHDGMTIANPIELQMRKLNRMIQELKADEERIKQLDPTTENLHAEMHGTLISYLSEIPSHLVEVVSVLNTLWGLSGGLQVWADHTAEHIDAIDSRIDEIEGYGESTSILPDDYDVLFGVVAGVSITAKKLLAGPFPIVAPDEEAKTALAELIAMAESARKILDQGRIDLDELEDFEDDDLDDELSDEQGRDPENEPS